MSKGGAHGRKWVHLEGGANDAEKDTGRNSSRRKGCLGDFPVNGGRLKEDTIKLRVILIVLHPGFRQKKTCHVSGNGKRGKNLAAHKTKDIKIPGETQRGSEGISPLHARESIVVGATIRKETLARSFMRKRVGR